MRFLTILTMAIFLSACGGGSSGGGGSSAQDPELIGKWQALGNVTLNEDGSCWVPSGNSETFYTMDFYNETYDVKVKICQAIGIAGQLSFEVFTQQEGTGVKYRTGTVGSYDVYENGVLTQAYKDMDVLNDNGIVTFYTTYYTDGQILYFSGIPDCGDGTDGDLPVSRCVPSQNIAKFTKID
ncbi:hypothetical protein AVO42_00385 [Thiomicrospira sp. XS5]|uniref:hypothetical protein n=1 Tax=Thiomicrospira sp. XS5 TaxID=1775636 RepID=UPI0007475B6B|nr:hypothetical protein [Thiomicrospira sp. XS5]KUJ73913.1 hypothetical protein AVO42_00385 [Thiomicrospira sp. XS5]